VTCDPNNYRPISLTVIACRVMERITANNLLNHLCTHKLISKEQHGFLPQGSVLGPILFLLYINDLVDVVNAFGGCKIKLFADDVKVYWVRDAKYEDTNILQKCIDAIQKWSILWQLPISHSKCYSMYFGVNNPIIVYKFGEVVINRENGVKDLGVFISENVKSSFHCNKLVDKTKRLCSMIFRCLKTRDATCLIRAYKSYILPVLEYNSSVWSPFLIKDIDCVESVQRYFTRRVFKRCGFPDSPYIERLARLQLPLLELRRIHKDLIMCYKIVHGNTVANVAEFFIFTNNPRTRGNCLKLYKRDVCLDIRKYFFSNRVIDIWNSLPNSCVLSENVNCFKHALLSRDFTVYLRGSHKRAVEVPD
jgi:ribonuclease P/MRP protein subunit RPP40